MLEESHRQMQDMPEELDRFAQHQAQLQPCEVDLLQSGRGQPHAGRQAHCPEQGLEPVVAAFDQDVVDEDALEASRDQVGNHQGQPGQKHEDERAPGGREPADQAHERAWPAPFLGKLGTGYEAEGDLGISPPELVHADRPAADRRIIQIDLPVGEPLDDEKVVPLPEYEERRLPQRQPLCRLAEGFDLKAVPLGGLLDVKGVAAVARDAAIVAQHIQGHKAAVILQDDPQRGGAALGGLHLQDRRRPDRAIPPGSTSSHEFDVRERSLRLLVIDRAPRRPEAPGGTCSNAAPGLDTPPTSRARAPSPLIGTHERLCPRQDHADQFTLADDDGGLAHRAGFQGLSGP